MTATQASLFEAPPSRGASRTTDPATSRTAARSMSGAVLRTQQADVLHAACRTGADCTAFEVWQHMGATFRRRPDGRIVNQPQQNVIGKRLGELVVLGMVGLTGVTRPGGSCRPCQVYALTTAGREVLG